MSFNQKRRLEFSIDEDGGQKQEIVEAKLIDSNGATAVVYVPDLTEMVAQKIHKLWELKDGIDTEKDRHTNPEDFIDLKRLMDQPDFDNEKVLKRIIERFLNGSDPKSHIKGKRRI